MSADFVVRDAAVPLVRAGVHDRLVRAGRAGAGGLLDRQTKVDHVVLASQDQCQRLLRAVRHEARVVIESSGVVGSPAVIEVAPRDGEPEFYRGDSNSSGSVDSSVASSILDCLFLGRVASRTRTAYCVGTSS